MAEEKQENKRFIPEDYSTEDTLTNRLRYALNYANNYTSIVEEINEYNQEGEQLKQQVKKHWKWRLIICGVALYATAGAIFAGIGAEKAYAIPLIALIAFVWTYKGKKISKCCEDFEQLAENESEKEARLNEYAEKCGHLISFIPQEYWDKDAIQYFFNAVSTGTANDLNQAIQQYNSYVQQQHTVQMHQTIYEQGLQLQQEIANLRSTVFNK